jgi:Flp pilus assembly protein TadB
LNPLVSFLVKDGIHYFLYFILFLAVYQLIIAINEKEINGRKVRRKVKGRLRKQVIEQKAEELKKDNQSLGKLELLLRATAKSETSNPSVFAFLLFSWTVGVGTFLLLIFRIGDVFISCGVALFASLIPYLYLKVKLRKRKSAISNNITGIIEELIHQYSANGHDMYKAVKNVSKQTKHLHYRRLFLQIASAMHLRQEKAVRDSIDVLVFTIGGTWAKRLGNIILTGYIRSDSVMKAMVHLSNDAQNTEGMLNQEKAASFGTFIAAISTVPFFIGTLIINNYLTRSFDYWDVQFGNPVLVFLLVVTCVMICVSLLVALYIRHPKNDI